MPEVTFKRQTVYHDGTQMIVAKEGDKRDVEDFRVQRLIDEGAIDKPADWQQEESDATTLPRADGFQVNATGETGQTIDKTTDAGGPVGGDAAGTGHEDGGQATGDSQESLVGKTKTELLEIADREGVVVDESATKAEITAAIEAGRNAETPPA